jgi:trehalose utilization protein
MSEPIKVLVWDENKKSVPVDVYPTNIRGAVADALNVLGAGTIQATTACLDDPDQGITAEILSNIDVLVWWGHARHGEVTDETAELVKNAVHNDGLGFFPLHSAHYSKPFRLVLGGPGHLKGGWREAENPADTEEITIAAPKHPIARGISNFTIHEEEMYGTPFDVPPYQVLVFQSHFPLGGEYFPSFTTTVGKGIDPNFTSGGGGGANQGEGAGRVFYFRPGHETYPTYHLPVVQQILYNAVFWLAKQSPEGY